MADPTDLFSDIPSAQVASVAADDLFADIPAAPVRPEAPIKSNGGEEVVWERDAVTGERIAPDAGSRQNVLGIASESDKGAYIGKDRALNYAGLITRGILKEAPLQAAATISGMIEGPEGVEPYDPDAGDNLRGYVRKSGEDFSKQVKEKLGDNFGAEMVQSIPSLGYSAATMPVTAAASAIGTIGGTILGGVAGLPTGPGALTTAGAGAVGGFAAGAAAGYLAMDRAAQTQILGDLADIEEQRMGRKFTRPEFQAFKKNLDDKVAAYGGWEAGPEALSNVIDLAILKGKPGGKLISRLLKKGAGITAAELPAETATQIGQSQALEGTSQARTGGPLSFTSPQDIATAAREVLPGVIVVGGGMAAASGVYDAVSKKSPDEAVADQRDALDAEMSSFQADFYARTGRPATQADFDAAMSGGQTLQQFLAKQNDQNATSNMGAAAARNEEAKAAGTGMLATPTAPTTLAEIPAMEEDAPAVAFKTNAQLLSEPLTPENQAELEGKLRNLDEWLMDSNGKPILGATQAHIDLHKNITAKLKEAENLPINEAAEDAPGAAISEQAIGEVAPENGAKSTTEVLAEYPSADGGLTARVAKVEQGFSVSHQDPESGEVLPTVNIFPTQEAADKIAQESINPAAKAPVSVDEAAHEAATSPTNDLTPPTGPQALAGNYKVGRVEINGFKIAVENPAGSIREDKHNVPPKWKNEMKGVHYGRISGTQAADFKTDGTPQELDAMIQEGITDPDNYDGPVFVVDQVDPKTGKFDEHKIIFGNYSPEEAAKVYTDQYQKGWKGLGAITQISMDDLSDWTANGNTKQAFSKDLQVDSKQVDSDNFDKFFPEEAAAPVENVKGPRSPAQLANDKKLAKARGTVNTKVDDLLTAIKKLGGMDVAQVLSAWGKGAVESEHVKSKKLVGKLVLHKKGRAIDDMMMSLVDYGYLESDDMAAFEALYMRAAAGKDIYGPEGAEHRADQMEIQRQPEAGSQDAGIDPFQLTAGEMAKIAEVEKLDAKAKELFDVVMAQVGGKLTLQEVNTILDELESKIDDFSYGVTDFYNEAAERLTDEINKRGDGGDQNASAGAAGSSQRRPGEGDQVASGEKEDILDTGEVQVNAFPDKAAPPSITKKSGTKGDGVTDLGNFELEAGLFDAPGNGVTNKAGAADAKSASDAAKSAADLPAAMKRLEELGVRFLIHNAEGAQKTVKPAGNNVQLNSGIPINEIIKLAGDIKAAMPKLVNLGVEVIEAGHKSYEKFMARMKALLGDAFQSFKKVMLQVYEMAKAKIKEQRGSISNQPIAAALDEFTEIEQRILDARGIGSKTVLQKVTERIVEKYRSFTRHRVELDVSADKEGEIADILRRAEDIQMAATNYAVTAIRNVIGSLNEQQRVVFEHVIMLRDLAKDARDTELYPPNGESQLPFGYEDAEQVVRHLQKWEAMIDDSVADSLRQRTALIKKNTRNMVKMGSLPKEVLENDDYFHHMVLAYQLDNNGQVPIGTASDFRVKKKGWQKGRKGSAETYNTDYVQAEFEYLAQSHGMWMTHNVLAEINGKFGIYKTLAATANRQNIAAVRDHFDFDITDPEAKAQDDPFFPYRQKMAIALGSLSDLAVEGELSVPAAFQDVVDELAEAANEDEETGEQGRTSNPKLFGLLSYLIESGGAGAMEAATIFKAIAWRNDLIDSVLGEGKNTALGMIPEGYKEFRPKPGDAWYTVSAVGDKVLEAVLKGDRQLQETDVRQVLARGRDAVWVLPENLVSVLERFGARLPANGLEKSAEQMVSLWKQSMLFSPFRLLKYNINNTSGDSDIVLATYPGIFKFAPAAAKILLAVHFPKIAKKVGSALTADQQQYVQNLYELGVLSSNITVSEVTNVEKALGLGKAMREIGRAPFGLAGKAWFGWWDTAGDLSTMRENILRLAAYQYFQANDTSKMYGVSNRKQIDQIKEKDVKSAILARELLGDYGNLSEAGQYIRRRLIPFWSWMEINAPRYMRLLRNVKAEGGSNGAVGVKLATVAAMKAGRTALKASVLMAMVSIYNHLVWPDEEEEWGATGRDQLHIILGRNAAGEIMSIRFQGALSDVLSWGALSNPIATAQSLYSGDVGFEDILDDMKWTWAKKLFGAAQPIAKGAVETAAAETYYPNPTSPRPVYDRVEHVFRLFGLNIPYAYAAGKPKHGDGVLSQLASDTFALVGHRSDPGQMAYYEVRSKIYDYLDKQAIQRPSGKPTDKGTSLHYYKQAMVQGDLTAAEKYLRQYVVEFGGTKQGIIKSVKLSAPTAALPKEHIDNFYNSLTPRMKQRIVQANLWYEKTYLKDAKRK